MATDCNLLEQPRGRLRPCLLRNDTLILIEPTWTVESIPVSHAVERKEEALKVLAAAAPDTRAMIVQEVEEPQRCGVDEREGGHEGHGQVPNFNPCVSNRACRMIDPLEQTASQTSSARQPVDPCECLLKFLDGDPSQAEAIV